jgi:hypothetical protein
MLGDREERDGLVRTLNRGRTIGWNDDEPAVVNTTMDVLFRKYSSPDASARTRLNDSSML